MNYRDEFDDPRDNGLGFLGTVGPKAAFFIVLIALAFMVGVVWNLYTGSSDSTEQNVPIVRADDGPYKVSPDDPGGMEIEHKDSTIFSSLSDDEGRVENLLADEDDEDPMPRSQLFAGLNTEEDPSSLHAETQNTSLDEPSGEDEERIIQQAEEAEDVIEEMIEGGVESVMPPAPEPVPQEANTKPLDLDIKPPVQEVRKVEPTAGSQIEIKRETTTQPASGDYYIQVGSVKSSDGAESEWKKIQDKYSVLSGFSHRVEKADLGDKGVFYRIQAGPVSQATANSACNTIKQTDPNGCLVKKK